MKNPRLTRILIGIAFAVPALTLSAWAEDDHHDHVNHETHTHAEETLRGRVISSVNPHLVFFLNADRKVEISAINDDGKETSITEQKVRLVGGNRSKPTRMNFIPHEAGLISDISFPPGNNFPIVLMVTPAPGAKMVIEKFTLNLNNCPTCSKQEYACICKHGDHEKDGHHDHGDHNGHDH